MPFILMFCNRFWSRSKFTGKAIYDTLINNMREAFNSVIVNARSKPIITMMEEIRIYLMKIWIRNMTNIKTIEGSLYPKIKKRLDKELEKTQFWIPRFVVLQFHVVCLIELFHKPNLN